MIRNAKHDVLTEIPEIGGNVMSQVFAFFEKESAKEPAA